MSEPLFEVGKEYKTRNGRPVRIYTIAGGHHQPIHGAIHYADGWSVEQWCADGRYHHDSYADGNLDLMPPKRGWWVNVYAPLDCEPSGNPASAWHTREKADRHAAPRRVACIYVEEGDGL